MNRGLVSFLLTVAVVAMVLIPGCIGQPQHASSPNQVTQTQMQTQTQTEQQIPAAQQQASETKQQACALIVQDVRSYREPDGDYVVTGHVVNTGSSTVYRAVVVVRFLDANGNVVEIGTEDLSYIGPGKTRYFEEEADDDVAWRITSYNISVQCL